jgi:hypothetical protein
MNYWLAEAEEWKQLRELPEPLLERVTQTPATADLISDEPRCESAQQDGSDGTFNQRLQRLILKAIA